MKNLKTFNSPMFGDLHTFVETDGKVLFKANDVAKALGYNDTAQAIRKHCKGVVVLTTPSPKGVQPTKFITESDVYRLVMRSKLPEAERFQDWVCEEVLPSIRKQGGYLVSKQDDTPEVIMARALLLADAKIKEKDQKIEQQKNRIEDLEVQTKYLRLIESTPGYVNINQIAQDYGWSAIRMNRKLHELQIQYYQGGQWILYAKHKDKGYVKSVTRIGEDGEAHMHTKWSQLGRRFIYNELRNELILPLCELY